MDTQRTESKRVTPAELVAVTLKYGDIGTIRRMGALLEREGVANPLLKKLEKALPKTFQPDPLDTDETKTRHGQPPLGCGHQ